jgi:cytoskeleton protein RodZ
VVSGKPPFVLVIGNAPAVQLQYDDRQIDLRPYTKVDVARLNLE